MPQNTTQETALILCGPQVRLPPPKELARLRQILLQRKTLYKRLTATLKDLPHLLQSLVDSDRALAPLSTSGSVDALAQWLDSGVPPSFTDSLPNTASLPFTVLLQVALYLEHIDRHGNGSQYARAIQSLQQHGIQGFCAGFLAAVAIGFSANDEELGKHVATSLRLATCIGAYVDINARYTDASDAVCALSVRWREGNVSRSRVDRLLAEFPQSYVACLTDSTCITVITNKSHEEQLMESFKAAGLRAKVVDINGRFHSYINHIDASQKLKNFVKSVDSVEYPKASLLRVPIRSNKTGELIAEDVSVTDIAIESILIHTADWYTTVRNAFDAYPTSRPQVTILAFEDGVLPLSLSQRGANARIANGVDESNEIDESPYPPHSVAIVGMAGRFPGANDVNQFWDLLESGASMVREVPQDRLDINSHRLAGSVGTRFWGNFIDDPESFDHRFFKKSSREVVSWDPEKRVLLEVVYEALESAGYFGPMAKDSPNDYGCYIGAVANNYYDNVACHPPNAYSMLGTSRAFFSGGIAHQFGFTGPAMTIDTACSSSLVAINAACRAIQTGECSRAVAGGTNVFTSPFDYQNLAAAGFLSPSGACKPFDASADGYCRGEGVAAVVLKNLSAALEDGDHILGVIVGSAVNQNHNDAPITVPCSSSQTEVYNKVLGMAKASASSVTYVEAHGTGTQVGDPIECQSIRDAFGGRDRKDKVHFGSVKGNIGHTEASAGVAGLIKVLLMMQHSIIPAQASYSSLNPKIPALEPDMMAIAKTSQPWHTSSKLACINSYGAAGSNAVIALRNALSAPSTAKKRLPITAKQPFLISASSENSLIAYSKKLQAYMEARQKSSGNSVHLSDVLFNLADRSNHRLAHTVTETISTLDDLKKLLDSIILGTKTPQKDANSSPCPVVMVFGGQENDFVGISEEAVEHSNLLRSYLDECDVEFRRLGYESLYPAIYQKKSIANLPTLHAALFAAQYGCALTWIDSGLRINCVVGHSFGQLTALCVSGCLSLRYAMKVVVGRAELIEKSWGPEKGSMIAVQSDYATVSNILETVNNRLADRKLEIACFNHPTSHVVAGTAEDVTVFEKYLDNNSVSPQPLRTKRLNVTHAFHSALSHSILPGLEKLARQVQWKKPTVPIEITTEEQNAIEPGAWLLPFHMRNAVCFSSAVKRLASKLGPCIWIEAGQGSSVISLVKNCLNGQEKQLYCPSYLNGSNAISSVAETTVELWRAGIAAQFWYFHRTERHDFEYLNLPPYAFEKTKHWLPFVDKIPPVPITEVNNAKKLNQPTHEFISFLEYKDSSKNEATLLVDPESERYKHLLNGHTTGDQALAPMSVYIELISRALLILTKDATFETHVLSMNAIRTKGAPIGLDAKKNVHIHLTRKVPDVNYWSFEFSSKLKEGGDNQIHLIGEAGLDKRDDPTLAATMMQWSALIGYQKCLSIMSCEDGEKMQGKHIYRALERLVHFGEMYHGIKSISYKGHEAAGKVAASFDPKLPPEEALYDTPTVDGMMQFAGVLVNYFAHPSGKDVLLCQGLNRVVTSGAFDITAGEWTAYSLLTQDDDERTVCDVYIFDPKSRQVVIAFIGFFFIRTSVSVLERSLRTANIGGPNPNPIARAAPVAAAPPVPAALPPVSNAVTNSHQEASKTAEVVKVLHNITDIPIDEISLDSALEDLGIDSLLVTEVLNDMQAAFGVELDPNEILLFPNVKAVCEHIDSLLGVGTTATNVPPALPTEQANSAKSQTVPVVIPNGEGRPSLQQVQRVFANSKDAYERAAVKTQAVGFWEKCYPHQAALVLAYVVEAYAKLGCDMAAIEAGGVAPTVPHLPQHTQLVRQLYRVLEDGGLISVDAQGRFIRTAKAADRTPAAKLFEQIIPEFPLHASVHKIVAAVGSELAECLTGTKDGLQLVFGNKENKKTLDDLYENWPLVWSGTIALGEFLEKAMESAAGTGTFRILEVGAGTGGTTKYLVRHLQALGLPFEYVFTDLSASLVAAAKRAFKDCPEMTFDTFDIEKDPPAAWKGSFHFVVSTNCVHATRDLTVSLTTLHKLLRPDGALALVEITSNMFWLDVAVGLFEGWWLMEDGREHAVTPEGLWQEHMQRAGFRAVDWTGGEEPEARTIRVIVGFP